MALGELPLIADVIERIGFGWGQVLQILIGGGVYFADGAEILLIGAVTMTLKQEWDLDRTERAMVVSIVFIGVFVGSLISGPMGDSCGRRPPILLSFFGVGAFSVVSAMCQSYIMLVSVRFFVGLFFGLGIPSWNALSGEIAPTDYRMISNIGGQVLFCAGEVYSAGLILIDDPQMRNMDWRWLILMGAIPAGVFLVLGYFMILEAPSWLALHGKYDKACEALRALANRNGKTNVDVEFQIARAAESQSLYTRLSRNMGIIFGPNFRYSTCVLCFSLYSINTFYYGGGMYAFVQVLPEIKSQWSPAFNLLIGAAFELPGIVLALLLAHYISRKISIIILFIGIFICIGSFLLTDYFSKGSVPSATAEIGMQISFFMFKLFCGGIFAFVYLYSMEVYPTIARNTGTALSISFGRLGAIFSPLIYEYLEEITGSYYSFFYFMMVLAVICGILVAFLPYETKGQALVDHEDEVAPVRYSRKPFE